MSRSFLCGRILFFALLAAGLALACAGQARGEASAPVLPARIVAAYPHDPLAFTQGLAMLGPHLMESTGLYGRSELRLVEIESGRVLSRSRLPGHLFGEGAAVAPGVGGLVAPHAPAIVQLTWQEGKALVYDAATFDILGEFRYQGEGWGLAFDGRRLLMSNGSSRLSFRDPATFEERGCVVVKDGGREVVGLNELAWLPPGVGPGSGSEGLVLANVWQSAHVVAVDPESGEVRWRLDLSEAWQRSGHAGSERNVPNGLAYDERNGRLLATGKFWPWLFALEIPQALPREGGRETP